MSIPVLTFVNYCLEDGGVYLLSAEHSSTANLTGTVRVWAVARGGLVGAEAAMTTGLALTDPLAFRCKCQEEIAVLGYLEAQKCGVTAEESVNL